MANLVSNGLMVADEMAHNRTAAAGKNF